MDKLRKHQYDIAYMEMAIAVSKLSYAVRHKVGAIIVSKDGQVISQGFNGTPTGSPNCCEHYLVDGVSLFSHPDFQGDYDCECQDEIEVNEQFAKRIKEEKLATEYLIEFNTKQNVLHAESNAITKCAKWGSSTDGATLYVTLSPCIECSKLIIQSGIKRVVYLEDYRDNSGLNLLRYESDVEVEKLDLNS